MIKFYSELNATMLGLSFGIVYALCTLLISLTALVTKLFDLVYAKDMVYIFQSIYPFYDLNVVGISLGIVYSFGLGFLFGWLIALLYNRFIR